MIAAPRSLQGRLLTMALAGVLLLWGGATALVWLGARHELDELLDAHLAQSAALLVAQQIDAEDDDDVVDAPQLHRYAPRVVFQVWHEGRLALRSANAPLEPMSAVQAGFDDVQREGWRWRVFAAHGAERDIQVYVGERVDSRGAILRAVLRGALWPVALVLPLLALAMWWSVRRGLEPLRALSATLARRDPQAVEPLALAGDAPAEMAPLVEALHGLFGRIGHLLASERRFTADAAHELRTPIAAIRAQAQVALGATGDAERRQALAQTLAGCDRAAHLVEQLLQLSRLEAGGAAAAAAAPVADLAAVARRTAGALAGQALARRQQLELEAEAASPVRGDEALLGVLVRNLLDNAIRYSAEGARVQARVAADAAGVVTLEVQDSGPGMSDADIARLGERFFRVLGHEAMGSGLGFSIVRRIAEATGASLRVGRSATLGGLRVELAWPAAGPPITPGAGPAVHPSSA